jgi:hypothetical protein
MCRRNVWAAGLALGLCAGTVGLALGQEPPRSGAGLLDRLFAQATTAPVVQKDEKKETKSVPAVPPSTVRSHALADFLRRMAVCDRLREIAEEAGNDELKNRADVLEMRAKDIYVQHTNPGSLANIDDDALERQLAPKGKSLTPLSAITGKSGGSQTSAEGQR